MSFSVPGLRGNFPLMNFRSHHLQSVFQYIGGESVPVCLGYHRAKPKIPSIPFRLMFFASGKGEVENPIPIRMQTSSHIVDFTFNPAFSNFVNFTIENFGHFENFWVHQLGRHSTSFETRFRNIRTESKFCVFENQSIVETMSLLPHVTERRIHSCA